MTKSLNGIGKTFRCTRAGNHKVSGSIVSKLNFGQVIMPSHTSCIEMQGKHLNCIHKDRPMQIYCYILPKCAMCWYRETNLGFNLFFLDCYLPGYVYLLWVGLAGLKLIVHNRK